MNLGRESSISVTVRVRPFTSTEASHLQVYSDEPIFMGDGSLASSGPQQTQPAAPSLQASLRSGPIRKVISVVDDKMLIFDPPETHGPNGRGALAAAPRFGSNTKRVREHRFVFDRLFDAAASQEEVYANTTRPLLDSVLDGYNATVFAYGATGCGKTHTISGTPVEPGIIFLTMKELFERIDELQDTKHIELSLSYLEIYNETIRDLLDPSPKSLILREDASQRISVSNLSVHKPENVHQVMDMIIQGNQNRTISPTEANATSSRSHAVLQINVVQRARTASVSEAHTFATLSIIDLAGSERASATKNRGERLIEGANINKSLLALGNCINALCDPRRRNHVPYRDSKLTRLLKFSLGGNCKTVMIVCVSPSSRHYDETLNTLKYADRAKKIKTKVIRNEHNLNRHVGSYLKMITEQKQEIEELRAREAHVVNIALANADKARAKCTDAIAEALEAFRQTIVKTTNQRQARAQAMARLRALPAQAAQAELILRKYSVAGSGSGTRELGEALRRVLTKLDQERQEMEALLKNNNDLVSPLDNAMHSLLRRLEDTRGWTQEHAENFITQAKALQLQAELEVLQNAMAATEINVEITDVLASALFRLIGDLNALNDVASQSGDDIKSFELVRLSDKFVESCRKQFTALATGNPISPSPSRSHSMPVIPGAGSPFKSSLANSPFGSSQKRPASSSSLTWESPSRSLGKSLQRRPLSGAYPLETWASTSGSNSAAAKRQSDLGLLKSGLTPPSTSSPSANKRLSLPIGIKSPPAYNSHAIRGSVSMKSLTSPPSAASANIFGGSSGIHAKNQQHLSPSLIPAPPSNTSTSFGINGGVRALRRQIAASGGVIPSSMKKHSVVIRSPLRNNRKAIKRVRWEDADEEEARYDEDFDMVQRDDEGIDIDEKDPRVPPSSLPMPSRIGLAVSPRPTSWASSSLPVPGTPSNLPRHRHTSSLIDSRRQGVVLSDMRTRTIVESYSPNSSTPSRTSYLARYGGISENTGVVAPVDKSTVDSVLFNDEDEEEETNENKPCEGHDMSIDTLPSPPHLLSRKTSLDAMDVDSFELSMVSNSAKPPDSTPPTSKPKILFGVKGDLRRKSSILPTSSANGSPSYLSPTYSSSAAAASTAQGNSAMASNGAASASNIRSFSGPVIPTPIAARPGGAIQSSPIKTRHSLGVPVFGSPAFKPTATTTSNNTSGIKQEDSTT